MRRHSACVNMLITLFVFMLDHQLASAETVLIDYEHRGWYEELGGRTFINYSVGDVSPGCFEGCHDLHNFFVFDLSSVTQPIISPNSHSSFRSVSARRRIQQSQSQRELRAARCNHINCDIGGWDRRSSCPRRLG